MTGQPIRSAISSRAALLVSLALAVSVCSGCGGSAGTTTGAGGTTGTGGAGKGGATSTGGTTGTGGTTSTGGTTGTGGAVSTGGTTGTGGNTSTGGTTGTGGSTSTGGTTGTGGAGGKPATGGTTGTGGAGGKPATGGTIGTGGAAGSSSAGSSGSCTAISDFQSWPSGKGPADIGPLAATNFKPSITSITSATYGGAGYAFAFAWFGALRFTKITGDTTNNSYLISHFEPYANGSVTVDNSASATVDYRAFGDTPLEIYQQNGDARCKTLGLARADAQWATPSSAGITSDARYWADDMYMITGLQVEAYRSTLDVKYLNRMVTTMLSYFTMLQQPGGLFWHTTTSKAYWGRANGWVAAGAAELLLDLPAGTMRDQIMAGFKKQIDALLPLQISGGTDDGMWRQVLDLTSAPAESSCTAMFTFALATALKNGWLSGSNYSTAARRGWLALAAKTNGSGQLSAVCPGTGAAPAGSLSSQQQFYATIALGSNDMHGQAPLLWAASKLLETSCPGVPVP